MQEIKYIDEKMVSEITGLALSTLRNARFKGVGIPFYRIGRQCVRYRLDEVIKYMETQKVETSC